MKKFLRICLIGLFTLLLLATLAASAYWYNWHKNTSATVVQARIKPNPAKVGQALHVETDISMPWYRMPDGVAQLSETDKFRLSGKSKVEFLSLNFSELVSLRMVLLAFT